MCDEHSSNEYHVVNEPKGPQWLINSLNAENTTFILFNISATNFGFMFNLDFVNQELLTKCYNALVKSNDPLAAEWFVKTIHVSAERLLPLVNDDHGETIAAVRKVAKEVQTEWASIEGQCFKCTRCEGDDFSPEEGYRYLENILKTGLCEKCADCKQE